MSHAMVRVLVWSLLTFPIVGLAQTVPLSQDSYVVPASGVNYGTVGVLAVGGANNSQSLVQFDLSALPSGQSGGESEPRPVREQTRGGGHHQCFRGERCLG